MYMDRYAVFGHPVSHSKSPLIHSLFAKQTKQLLEYTYVEPGPNEFISAIREFFAYTENKGANITAPFKLEAFDCADSLTPRAKLAGAVNTLIRQSDNTIVGDNTDGQGLVEDLQRLWGSLQGKRLLLIGAGGATRGVIMPLFTSGVSLLHIANRSADKAQQLAEDLKECGEIVASGLDELKSYHFDGVINCSSSSLFNELPAISKQIFEYALFAYDMSYKPSATCFMDWAKASNNAISVSDGLGMLVAQAAESFFQWRNIRPQITPVIESVRNTL